MKTEQPKYHCANPLMRLALASAIGVSASGAWAFSYNGDEGPEYWWEIGDDNLACKGLDNDDQPDPNPGKARQSPIDIGKAKVDPQLYLELSIIRTSRSQLENNGHTIELQYDSGSTAFFNNVEYELKQYHFHTYSENKVNGEHLDMEMHGVFDAVDGTKRNLVVSQLFNVSNKKNAENSFLQNLINEGLPKKEKEVSEVKESDFTNGLVKPGSFYTYEGSLTTPPCSETVTWVVLKNAAKMTESQFQAFRTIMGNNFRPVQELNGRTIYQTPGQRNH